MHRRGVSAACRHDSGLHGSESSRYSPPHGPRDGSLLTGVMMHSAGLRSARSLQLLAALVALPIVAGCSGNPQKSVASDSATPAADARCRAEPAPAAICRFVSAVEGGDLSGLSEGERALVSNRASLPKGDWKLNSCQAVGDLTAECQVTFQPSGSSHPPRVVTFDANPSNGTYDAQTGQFTPPSGGDVEYEVVDYRMRP